MGVLKKTSSGKALQFITDEGDVYQCSFKLFMGVVNDQINGEFVVLTRMALGVPPGRFPKSVVYGGEKAIRAGEKAGVDAFSKSFKRERDEQRAGEKQTEYKVEW
jgi:hypothetical protein